MVEFGNKKYYIIPYNDIKEIRLPTYEEVIKFQLNKRKKIYSSVSADWWTMSPAIKDTNKIITVGNDGDVDPYYGLYPVDFADVYPVIILNRPEENIDPEEWIYIGSSSIIGVYKFIDDYTLFSVHGLVGQVLFDKNGSCEYKNSSIKEYIEGEFERNKKYKFGIYSYNKKERFNASTKEEVDDRIKQLYGVCDVINYYTGLIITIK